LEWPFNPNNGPGYEKELRKNQEPKDNEALNGTAVVAWRNQPNHNAYNNLIKSKLDALPSNLTPDQAYSELVNILNQAKQAIINNPNTHLND
jgi:hypothetical protein